MEWPTKGQLRLRGPDRPGAAASGGTAKAKCLDPPAKSLVVTAAPFTGPESGRAGDA
jgi:hypothetical protein